MVLTYLDIGELARARGWGRKKCETDELPLLIEDQRGRDTIVSLDEVVGDECEDGTDVDHHSNIR